MEWADRLGAMYQFFIATPALAHDMAINGPQTDFAYSMAFGLQNTAADINVYPADTQTAGG